MKICEIWPNFGNYAILDHLGPPQLHIKQSGTHKHLEMSAWMNGYIYIYISQITSTVIAQQDGTYNNVSLTSGYSSRRWQSIGEIINGLKKTAQNLFKGGSLGTDRH